MPLRIRSHGLVCGWFAFVRDLEQNGFRSLLRRVMVMAQFKFGYGDRFIQRCLGLDTRFPLLRNRRGQITVAVVDNQPKAGQHVNCRCTIGKAKAKTKTKIQDGRLLIQLPDGSWKEIEGN